MLKTIKEFIFGQVAKGEPATPIKISAPSRELCNQEFNSWMQHIQKKSDQAFKSKGGREWNGS